MGHNFIMTLKLKKWIHRQGFKLSQEPGQTDCVLFDPVNAIFINSKSSRDSRIATILHECGHIMVRSGRHNAHERESKNPIVGVTFTELEDGTGRYRPKSKSKAIAIITEEIEAWNRGWHLKKRLKIRISKKRFDAIRTKALMTYMRFHKTKKVKPMKK